MHASPSSAASSASTEVPTSPPNQDGGGDGGAPRELAPAAASPSRGSPRRGAGSPPPPRSRSELGNDRASLLKEGWEDLDGAADPLRVAAAAPAAAAAVASRAVEAKVSFPELERDAAPTAAFLADPAHDQETCCERMRASALALRAEWHRPEFRTLLLIAVLGVFTQSDQNLISPLLTTIARSFNMTDDERDTYIGGYIPLGFFMVGALATIVTGFLTDKVNRVALLAVVVFVGEFSCFMTFAVTDYWSFFATRVLTGISIGGSVPLVLSLLGDLYTDESRGKVVAVVTLANGFGTIVGQGFAGLAGPALGWRAPFVMVAVPTLVLAPVFWYVTPEPRRGSKERAAIERLREKRSAGSASALSAALEGEGAEGPTVAVVRAEAPRPHPDDAGAWAATEDDDELDPKVSWAKIRALCLTPSAVLIWLSALPSSVPSGFISTFMQDFLVNNLGPSAPGGISVQQSTAVLLTYGVGAAVAVVVGGFAFDALWARRPLYTVVFWAAAQLVAPLPLYAIINAPAQRFYVYALLGFPVGFLSGLTSVPTKPLLLNVTHPHTRGAAFGLNSLSDDLGRGLGPFWVSLLVQQTHSRVLGFNIALSGECRAPPGWGGCAGTDARFARRVAHWRRHHPRQHVLRGARRGAAAGRRRARPRARRGGARQGGRGPARPGGRARADLRLRARGQGAIRQHAGGRARGHGEAARHVLLLRGRVLARGEGDASARRVAARGWRRHQAVRQRFARVMDPCARRFAVEFRVHGGASAHSPAPAMGFQDRNASSTEKTPHLSSCLRCPAARAASRNSRRRAGTSARRWPRRGLLSRARVSWGGARGALSANAQKLSGMFPSMPLWPA